jgi:hypothetical protein
MPTVHWDSEPNRIRYHFSCLERFDLQKKLDRLEKFLQFQILFSGARRTGGADQDITALQDRGNNITQLFLEFNQDVY